jgi:ADP-ribosylglycohydrolase
MEYITRFSAAILGSSNISEEEYQNNIKKDTNIPYPKTIQDEKSLESKIKDKQDSYERMSIIEKYRELASKDPLLDNVLGCLFAGFLGDSWGLSSEFLTKEECLKLYPDGKIPFPKFERNNHNSRWNEGDWTDDSDHEFLVMQTISEVEEFENYSKTFAKKLKNWISFGFKELNDNFGMGIGETTSKICSSEKFLEDPSSISKEIWENSGKSVAPNGSLMRTSCLGLFEYREMSKVIKNTLEFCKITHYDPRCLASCLFHTMIISEILTNGRFKTKKQIDLLIKAIWAKIKVELSDYENFQDYISEIEKHIIIDGTEKYLEGLKLDEKNKIGYVLKALGASIWGLYATTEDYGKTYEEAIQMIIICGGDADTNCKISGGLIGANLGFLKIPDDKLKCLLHLSFAEKNIDTFLKKATFIKEKFVYNK